MRTGVLAIKRGMTAFYTKRGTRIRAPVHGAAAGQRAGGGRRGRLRATDTGPCRWARGLRLPQRTTAPLLGYYEAKGLPPKQHLARVPRARPGRPAARRAATLLPDWFHIGQWVDVRSNTRGMGFAGGMKRHGFAGQGKSHGNSLNHRTMGSVGPSQGSGSRVLPGKKMPGRMGGQQVTVQNLAVLKVDNDLGIVVVKGAVGGPKGCMVKIQDARQEAAARQGVRRGVGPPAARKVAQRSRAAAGGPRETSGAESHAEGGAIAELLADGVRMAGGGPGRIGLVASPSVATPA